MFFQRTKNDLWYGYWQILFFLPELSAYRQAILDDKPAELTIFNVQTSAPGCVKSRSRTRLLFSA